MPDVTVIIPIGPNHVAIAERAIASVRAQTVPCDLLTEVDTEKVGPGRLRNRMLIKTSTPFVVFLDADDWIEPTFVEETLAEHRRIGGDKYIFTDWIDADGRIVETPCLNGAEGYPLSVPDRKPYCGGTWHVVTTLVPTEWAKAVGGFDEDLRGAEDTDFYLKLCTTYRCGHRLPRALFHYSPNGGRAIEFRQGAEHERTMREFTIRYGGKMGCCGNEEKISAPIGQKQDGDVLAMALWNGNRGEYGRVTGRSYPRISMPRTAWVDPRDAAAAPHLWRVIEHPTVDEKQPMSLHEMAQAMLSTIPRTPVNPFAAPVNEPPPPPVAPKPDIERIKTLATRPRNGDPVFVFPEKDYPSYADIKRLVQLSGWKIITTKQIDAFSRAPYIVVSPEPLNSDLNGLRARVICWQLEYAGDYTNNYHGFTGEMWSSDASWATVHGAKYVPLGSHPDLALPSTAAARYDVTMLGYLTPRRGMIKEQLKKLEWAPDYPGHGEAQARADLLTATRLMLHVHQHDNAPFVAPQRIAIAAAYRMPVVSETVADAGALADVVTYADYDKLPAAVNKALKDKATGDALHDLLCRERTFKACVEEALK